MSFSFGSYAGITTIVFIVFYFPPVRRAFLLYLVLFIIIRTNLKCTLKESQRLKNDFTNLAIVKCKTICNNSIIKTGDYKLTVKRIQIFKKVKS